MLYVNNKTGATINTTLKLAGVDWKKAETEKASSKEKQKATKTEKQVEGK